jgi:transposase-like protein
MEITHDLRWLQARGVICASITSDGSTGIHTAVNLVYPDIPHQRCVVHIQRQALAWLTRNPKTVPGQHVKPLVQELSTMETWEHAHQWTTAVLDWEKHFHHFLKQRTYLPGTRRWWYTHRSLRRVRALIVHAIPNLFHYLDDPSIPKTSNGLEGRFGSLKNHYRQHRGLSKERREAYLAWYLAVVVNGEKPTRFDY